MKRNFERIRDKYINSFAKKEQFKYFHRKMVSFSNLEGCFPELEIGSGVTPMKDNFPNIISSDIESNPYSEMKIDAVNLPFNNNSLGNIYAVNTFHHISDKRKFIDECYRVLSNKGKLIILEPSYSLLASIIYPFLFRDETYKITDSIDDLKTCDPMIGANQAASYICFFKSKKEFLEGSGFNISKIYFCRNSISYLLSGGLNFLQLLPFFIIKKLMNINLPEKIFSLHWIIVLEKL